MEVRFYFEKHSQVTVSFPFEPNEAASGHSLPSLASFPVALSGTGSTHPAWQSSEARCYVLGYIKSYFKYEKEACWLV